jgi:hypothetical protein
VLVSGGADLWLLDGAGGASILVGAQQARRLIVVGLQEAAVLSLMPDIQKPADPQSCTHSDGHHDVRGVVNQKYPRVYEVPAALQRGHIP